MAKTFTQKAMSVVVNQDTGTDTSDATAVAGDIRAGKTAYVAGGKVTGTIEDMTTTGRITFGCNSEDKISYTSGSSYNKLVAKATVTSDSFSKKGDVIQLALWDSVVQSKIGLTADKIAVGQEIMEVAGTYTSDANATAADIASGKTAYVNGSKLTGTATFTQTSTGVAYTVATINTATDCAANSVTTIPDTDITWGDLTGTSGDIIVFGQIGVTGYVNLNGGITIHNDTENVFSILMQQQVVVLDQSTYPSV